MYVLRYPWGSKKSGSFCLFQHRNDHWERLALKELKGSWIKPETPEIPTDYSFQRYEKSILIQGGFETGSTITNVGGPTYHYKPITEKEAHLILFATKESCAS